MKAIFSFANGFVSLGMENIGTPLACMGAVSYMSNLQFWFVAPLVLVGAIVVLSMPAEIAATNLAAKKAKAEVKRKQTDVANKAVRDANQKLDDAMARYDKAKNLEVQAEKDAKFFDVAKMAMTANAAKLNRDCYSANISSGGRLRCN